MHQTKVTHHWAVVCVSDLRILSTNALTCQLCIRDRCVTCHLATGYLHVVQAYIHVHVAMYMYILFHGIAAIVTYMYCWLCTTMPSDTYQAMQLHVRMPASSSGKVYCWLCIRSRHTCTYMYVHVCSYLPVYKPVLVNICMNSHNISWVKNFKITLWFIIILSFWLQTIKLQRAYRDQLTGRLRLIIEPFPPSPDLVALTAEPSTPAGSTSIL